MTEHEKKIIQQEEQRLRDEAAAHAARALAATDDVVRRVELHQYNLNQYAAVKLYHLQRLLQSIPDDPDQAAAVLTERLISEIEKRIQTQAVLE